MAESVCTFIEPFFATLSDLFLVMISTTLAQTFPVLRDAHRTAMMSAVMKRIGSVARKRRYKYEYLPSGQKVKVRAVQDLREMGCTTKILLRIRRMLMCHGVDADQATLSSLDLHHIYQFGKQGSFAEMNHLVCTAVAEELDRLFPEQGFELEVTVINGE